MSRQNGLSIEAQQKLYDALKEISRYYLPESLKKVAEKKYGLPEDEVIEYAYENVIMTAADAVRGVKRPKSVE